MKIPAQVYKNINEATLLSSLAAGRIVILSVDLKKSSHIRHHDSHLILVYGYDAQNNTFQIHDSANAIAPHEKTAHIAYEYLCELSNHRGLIVG